MLYKKNMILLFYIINNCFYCFFQKFRVIILIFMTILHKIGMVMSSKHPPAGDNKYYFLKVNIEDYYHIKFHVYIIFSFRKNCGG